jgi:betaine-aldehyde dehydrogenase
MSAIHHQSIFIDNVFRDSSSKQRLASVNPATEATIAEISAGTPSDVHDAVTAAHRAFESGPWPRLSGSDRAVKLREIADQITARRAKLAELESADSGKPLAEAEFDIDDAATCFRYYAQLGIDLDANREEPVVLEDKRFVSIARREPIGVVGAVIPWNFPLLMLAWKVAPALAAGCTIVLKPSELTSLTAIEFAKIVADVALPPGVFNLVTGFGPDAGHPLVTHPLVEKVAFTGSVRTGSAIMKAAADDVKVVTLELGGKSAMIVFDDVDVVQAVEWIMVGVFFNQGEVCSSTSRVLLHESIAPQVLARLKVEAEKLVVGDPQSRDTKMGPLVSKGQHDKVLAYIEQGKKSGAQLLTGGARKGAHGYYVQPTVFTDVPLDATIWKEEIFGPVLSVRTFKTEEEALRIANDTTFGLGGAVISKDLERARRVANALRAGIIWINCSQPTFCQAPWGGFKRSGIGRELGKWGLANYLQTKQITRFDQSEPWGYYIPPANL